MIKIAIIGTGGMGHHHARVFQHLEGCTLVAACGPDRSKVAEFAKAFKIQGVYTRLTVLLDHADVDALVIAAPDRHHASLSLQGIAAGKHILCEKPLAENYAQAQEMTRAAQQAKVINMVNFTYRQSAALHQARRMVQEGALGRVIHVEGSHLQSWLGSNTWGNWRKDPSWLRKLSIQHGSQGVLGDLGGHLFDFASYVAGDFKSVQCQIRTFDKNAGKQIDGYVLDANDSAVLNAELKNGALGTFHMSRWATGYTNRVCLAVYGDKGALRVSIEDSDDVLEVCSGADVDRGTWKTMPMQPLPTNQQRFVAAIQAGTQVQPDFARGTAVQQVIDVCYASALDGEGKQIP